MANHLCEVIQCDSLLLPNCICTLSPMKPVQFVNRQACVKAGVGNSGKLAKFKKFNNFKCRCLKIVVSQQSSKMMLLVYHRLRLEALLICTLNKNTMLTCTEGLYVVYCHIGEESSQKSCNKKCICKPVYLFQVLKRP